MSHQDCYHQGCKGYSTPLRTARRAIGLEEAITSFGALVRYLYAPGVLEDGHRSATDPIWSMTTHTIDSDMRQEGQPALYCLTDGSVRLFDREELFIVPDGTELPPVRIVKSCVICIVSRGSSADTIW